MADKSNDAVEFKNEVEQAAKAAKEKKAKTAPPKDLTEAIIEASKKVQKKRTAEAAGEITIKVPLVNGFPEIPPGMIQATLGRRDPPIFKPKTGFHQIGTLRTYIGFTLGEGDESRFHEQIWFDHKVEVKGAEIRLIGPFTTRRSDADGGEDEEEGYFPVFGCRLRERLARTVVHILARKLEVPIQDLYAEHRGYEVFWNYEAVPTKRKGRVDLAP